ncbi:S-methyl-5'-thioadenosine phosphorylase-like isoform X2 [Onthophagus taurus]|uniref:S-methyl-5'-thioadenosine phosphorylase-like isoform X2 n=1 Tax=Onthophagus taurus TaxID=166361 RepID=UPI000C200C9B|nr:S-methyl-5'-thioadenosine phosphorylase-like isoform X3 [Onthophagus taurus]
MSSTVKIGIIGGTGLDDPDILKNRNEKQVTTQFGDPSGGKIVEGEIEGVPCVIVSRHGPTHDINPSNVNYRGNIWALKDAGCTHIIATTATGSLKEEVQPGDLVVVDDFIDRTQGRKQTFYDGSENGLPGLFHLPMNPPFSQPLREVIMNTAEELGLKHHKQGTVVSIEGPRFSSKAESKIFQMYGGAVINMSTVPEVVLAKEAGLLYSAIALVTDYDCWKDDYQTVSHNVVLQSFQNNVEKLKTLLIAAVQKVAAKNWDKEIQELQEIRVIY